MPEVYDLAFVSNASEPRTCNSFRTKLHTHPRRIQASRVTVGVPHVLLLAGLSEIQETIVRTVTVRMINLFSRPATSHIEERQSVLQNSRLEDTDVAVSIESLTTGPRTSNLAPNRRFVSPMKEARLRAIAQSRQHIGVHEVTLKVSRFHFNHSIASWTSLVQRTSMPLSRISLWRFSCFAVGTAPGFLNSIQR